MHRSDDRSCLTPELLGAPAQQAVRVIASALLQNVLQAHDRFREGDAEGLHDLRVDMRRLRSWMRAFRPELSDTVRGRTRRRLRALASATNEARDNEVLLAFLERQTNLPPRPRATARALTDRLARARDEHARGLRRTLSRDLTRAAHALEDQLESWWERHRVDERREAQPMSAALADAILDHTRRLETALERIEPASKASDAHRARLAVKRLRYLLEPLDESLGASEPIGKLQALQRHLGDARDAHRIAMHLVREIGERSARDARRRALASVGIIQEEDADPPDVAVTRTGLTELARRAHAAGEAAFSELAAHWDDPEIATLLEQLRDVGTRVTGG